MGERKVVRVVRVVTRLPRNETLTEQQRQRARAVYDGYWRFVDPQTDIEHFERGFVHEVDPDRELAVMETMSLALALAKPEDDEVRDTAKLVLWLSSHVAKPDPSQFRLSRRVVDRVCECWSQAKRQTGTTETLIEVVFTDPE